MTSKETHNKFILGIITKFKQRERDIVNIWKTRGVWYGVNNTRELKMIRKRMELWENILKKRIK